MIELIRRYGLTRPQVTEFAGRMGLDAEDVSLTALADAMEVLPEDVNRETVAAFLAELAGRSYEGENLSPQIQALDRAIADAKHEDHLYRALRPYVAVPAEDGDSGDEQRSYTADDTEWQLWKRWLL